MIRFASKIILTYSDMFRLWFQKVCPTCRHYRGSGGQIYRQCPAVSQVPWQNLDVKAPDALGEYLQLPAYKDMQIMQRFQPQITILAHSHPFSKAVKIRWLHWILRYTSDEADVTAMGCRITPVDRLLLKIGGWRWRRWRDQSWPATEVSSCRHRYGTMVILGSSFAVGFRNI